MNGLNVKVQMEILIDDSSVTIKADNQEVVYKRKEATSGIYFTDGVTTSSLTDFQKEGKLKGFAYNSMITIIPNITSPTISSTQYCWKKR